MFLISCVIWMWSWTEIKIVWTCFWARNYLFSSNNDQFKSPACEVLSILTDLDIANSMQIFNYYLMPVIVSWCLKRPGVKKFHDIFPKSRAMIDRIAAWCTARMNCFRIASEIVLILLGFFHWTHSNSFQKRSFFLFMSFLKILWFVTNQIHQIWHQMRWFVLEFDAYFGMVSNESTVLTQYLFLLQAKHQIHAFSHHFVSNFM